MADHASTSSSENVLSSERFLDLVENYLGKELERPQKEVIVARPDQSLFVVAGPGSGKTSVIVLRILKLILVDRVAPESILATTFTRKAARELKSRILEWGKKIIDKIREEHQTELTWNDLTKVRTGTIDSIIQEALSHFLKPGESLPTLIDDLTAVNLMRKVIRKQINKNEGFSILAKAEDFKTIRERLYQDMFIDDYFGNKTDIAHQNKESEKYYKSIDDFLTKRCKKEFDKVCRDIDREEAKEIIKKIICWYEQALRRSKLIDFVLMEEFFRMILYNKSSDINDCFMKILNRQACNPESNGQDSQQESNEPEKTQSSNKESREQNNNSLPEYIENLKVIFVDEYQDTNPLQESIYFKLAELAIQKGGSITVVGDDDQSIYRFRGSKVEVFKDFEKNIKDRLSITVEKPIYLNTNFRSTECIVKFCEYFATSYEKYRRGRLKKDEMKVSGKNSQSGSPERVKIITAATEKELAKKLYDHVIQTEMRNKNKCVLLCFSTKEKQRQKDKKRLSGHLREHLKSIFNPRGVPIHSVEEIKILCGAIFHIIDEKGEVLSEIKKDSTDLIINAIGTIEKWKEECKKVIGNKRLDEVARELRKTSKREKFTLIQLIYMLVSEVDELRPLREDTEKAAYLEAILRVISGFKLIGEDDISLSTPDKIGVRVKDFIYNIFIPIVLDEVGLDEELLEMVPDKDFQIMTIHQSKGLEFDTVIVYVEMGNDYDKDEEKIADLIRLYYVAFSRAKEKLVVAYVKPQSNPRPPWNIITNLENTTPSPANQKEEIMKCIEKL